MLALWSALFGLAHAQVNAEALADQAKEEGFGFGLSLGTALSAGNVNYFALRGEAGVQYLRAFDEAPNAQLWMRDRVFLNARGAYQTFEGTPIVDERLAHLRYTHMFKPHIGAEAFLQAQNDLALLLEWRLLAGAGVRYVVFNEPRVGLSLGAAYMAEYELRDVPAGGPDAQEVLNHRLSTLASWRAVLSPDHLNWTNTVYLQPRLDDFTDLQFVDESAFEFVISKNLSFNTGLRLRLDTQPPTEVVPLDLRWTTGLTLRWAQHPDEPQR